MISRRQEPKSTRKKINVWIVDDDPRYRTAVSDELNQTSTVRLSKSFGNSQSFLEALRTDGKRPTVVLLDIRLPDINGLDAIPHIKQVCPSLKIIILTAFDNDAYVFKAVNEGADGFLLKHSSAGEMVKAIASVAAGYKVMDPKAQAKFERIAPNGLGSTGHLTVREKEVSKLVLQGLTLPQIAQQMCLSLNTIQSHLKSIHTKLHVHKRSELLIKLFSIHSV